VVNSGQNSRSVADTVTGYILAYFGILLIFMSVYLYGYGVATGVAEEKSNRIMEILVNAATPFQLMVGKIVGLGALLLETPVKTLLFGTSAGG
jgi:ABC-2 type transport system permease protein